MCMKLEEITAEYVRSILDYDPISGVMVWKPRVFTKKTSGKWNDVYAGKEAGSVFKNGYRMLSFGRGQKQYTHRIIWLWMTGDWPKNNLDHIDTIKLNNVWINLRECDHRQNMGNQGVRKNNTSGYKGVSYSKKNKCYQAYITVQRKKINLGYYKNIEIAAEAYRIAAKKYYGEFARTA